MATFTDTRPEPRPSGVARQSMLDGQLVPKIYSDLSGSDGTVDLTHAARLLTNRDVAFQGPVKVGPFDVEGHVARGWLRLPANPNGRYNSDVTFPLINGSDITRRTTDRWIVNFGERPEEVAALYEAPFEFVRATVKPLRDLNRDEWRRSHWWRLGRSGGDLVAATADLDRFVLTPRVAKHRIFVWGASSVLPDSAVVAIARNDDTSFGILHSRFHELWSLRMGTFLGVGNDPRYTPSTTFETFPFPEGLTPDIPAADYADDPCAQTIAAAAARLNELRESWLNPPDLVERVPEVVPGYPDRILPKDEAAANELKRRTLTNLYNDCPQWLANAHAALDRVVADAYGWGEAWKAEMSDEDILVRLFALNRARSTRFER